MNSFLHFHVTVPGASHIRKGAACQDFSKSVCFGDACAAAVADGHGDIRYFRSGTGSRFAVEAALKALREFVSREESCCPPDGMDEKLNQLKKNMILNWNRKVARHLSGHPFTPDELAPLSENRRANLTRGKWVESAYGTTLIAAAVTPAFWFGMQIGDGDCCAFRSDGTCASVPKEPGLAGNVTTSLCEPDAIEKFHHFFEAGVPASVVMSTDGVRNSFLSREHYRKFLRKIVSAFSAEPYRATKTNLRDFMAEMTEKGSGDDLSVAGMVSRGEPPA